MEEERSYGVIPLSKKNQEWFVFLVQLKSGNHWGFPKGHPEKNEDPKASAIRELKEEANLQVARFLQEDPLKEQYTLMRNGNKVNKTVYYYLVEAEGEFRLQQGEILDGNWFTLEDAYKKITYSQSRALLKEVEKRL